MVGVGTLGLVHARMRPMRTDTGDRSSYWSGGGNGNAIYRFSTTRLRSLYYEPWIFAFGDDRSKKPASGRAGGLRFLGRLCRRAWHLNPRVSCRTSSFQVYEKPSVRVQTSLRCGAESVCIQVWAGLSVLLLHPIATGRRPINQAVACCVSNPTALMRHKQVSHPTRYNGPPSLHRPVKARPRLFAHRGRVPRLYAPSAVHATSCPSGS